jgi:Holliday junction resolvase RusA-like endonuclease
MQSCPAIEIIVDLPFPPSVNKIWRTGNDGRVRRSNVYLDWIAAADIGVMARRQYPKRKITGSFEAHIVLGDGGRGDLDNRIKAVLDWAQSRDLIRNDSDCQRLIAEWGDAEHGCRLTLRGLNER